MNLKLITEHKDYLLLVDKVKSSGDYVYGIDGKIYGKNDFMLKISCRAIIAASPKLGDLPLLPELPKYKCKCGWSGNELLHRSDINFSQWECPKCLVVIINDNDELPKQEVTPLNPSDFIKDEDWYIPKNIRNKVEIKGGKVISKQEEDVEQLSKISTIALEEYEKKFEVKLRGLDIDIWKAGWQHNQRAASKKWSDEEAEIFFREGYNLCLSKHYDLLKDKIHPDEEPFQTPSMDFEETKQSLSPTLTPIEFEPEYLSELSAYYKNGLGGKQELKVVNGVLQGRWIYA